MNVHFRGELLAYIVQTDRNVPLRSDCEIRSANCYAEIQVKLVKTFQIRSNLNFNIFTTDIAIILALNNVTNIGQLSPIQEYLVSLQLAL